MPNAEGRFKGISIPKDIPDSRTCTKCKVETPESDMRARPHTWCKACHTAAVRDYTKRKKATDPEWVEKDRERRRIAARRQYHEGNGRTNGKRSRLQRFGLTIEAYDAMVEDQGGVCAICGGTCSYNGGSELSVDHCHETNEVRGLLCKACNLGLGYFRDNVQNLSSAIQYLERSQTPKKAEKPLEARRTPQKRRKARRS